MMRTSRLLPLTALASAGLTGCQADERADPQRAGGPADRQELIVGAGEDEFGLDLNRHRLGNYPLNATICEPLVRLTRDFQVEPWLATRWESTGGDGYRLTLRPGVRFHDGQPLSAEAVRYTLDREIREQTQYSFLSTESVRVVDDTTVEIRPAVPNLRVLEQLVHPTYALIAPGSDPTRRPQCTGPFRFAEYVSQDHLTVVRNDDYWRGPARLRKLTFRFIADDNTRALALRSGEVDAIFDVNRGMVAGLKATPGIRIVTAPPGAVMLIYVATRGTPPHTLLSDPTLRRAVALAIDRRALVERVLDGYATVVSTVNPPSVLGPYAGRVAGIPFDPAEAARLLDASGWRLGGGGVRAKNGRRLRLTLLANPVSVEGAVPEYVQAQLARVGIEVQIERLDLAAWESRLNAGHFDLDIEVPNQNDANPAFLLALRWYGGSNVRSAKFMAAGTRFDSLVRRALSLPDHDEVRRTAAEAMHVLVDEEVAAIPLAGLYRIYAMKERVRGFEAHPSKANQWWNTVWLAQ